MGTTSDFVKLRSAKNPKTGKWNKDYTAALTKAKKEGKFIVTAWSNGDACGDCIAAEKCMMTSVFKKWMEKQDAYFVFQYSGDKDKGKTVHDWIYVKTGLKYYPGFRITLYDANGNVLFDKAIEGNKLRNNKIGTDGAKAMTATIDKYFASVPAIAPTPAEPTPATTEEYKVRLNESLTTAQVNKILDAIDKADGYCPCQPKSEESKCHCADFVKSKKIGEPCICKIYVKQKKNK